MSHETRCLYTTTGHRSQLGEGHSQRSLSGILTVSDNNTVGERLDTAYTLKASAGCHRFLHDGVQGNLFQSTLREFLNNFVYILVLTDSLINRTLFSNNLARSVRIQLVGSFCIQP